jgi:hypothetical protein
MWTTAGLTVSARVLKFCGTIRTGASLAAVACGRPVPSNSPTIIITTVYLANLNVGFIFSSLFWYWLELAFFGQTINQKVNAKMTPG